MQNYKLLICLALAAVGGCMLQSNVLEREFDVKTCQEQCLSCKNMTICLGGSAYNLSCSANQACAVIGGYVSCQNNTPTDSDVPGCSCANVTGVLVKADPYNPHYYLVCANSGLIGEGECPGDKVFDESSQECVEGGASGQCTSAGVFPDINDCTKYFICFKNPDGTFTKFPEQCPAGQIFSPSLQNCINNTAFSCAGEPDNLYADPFECEAYHLCRGGSELGSPQCCSAGQYFDESTHKCAANTGQCTSMDLSCRPGGVDFCPDSPGGTTVPSGGTTSNPNAPTCDSEGQTFPYPGDCQKFFKCEYSEGSLVANVYSCPGSLEYNPATGYCDYPENVNCSY